MTSILKINKILSDEKLMNEIKSCETLEAFKKVLISYGLEFTADEMKILYERICRSVLNNKELDKVSGGSIPGIIDKKEDDEFKKFDPFIDI